MRGGRGEGGEIYDMARGSDFTLSSDQSQVYLLESSNNGGYLET